MPDSYTARITGAANGQTDFDFRLKSYNGLHYSGLTSHLSFQLPRELDTVDNVLLRSDGDIVLLKNGVELFTANIISFDFFEGASSKTVSIRATYQRDETNPKTVPIVVSEIINEADGARIFKIPYQEDFNPLDSVSYESEIIPVDKVTLHLALGNIYMLLREDAVPEVVEPPTGVVTHNGIPVTHNGINVTHNGSVPVGNVVTHNGEAITHNGIQVTHGSTTPPTGSTVTHNAVAVTHNGIEVTHTP